MKLYTLTDSKDQHGLGFDQIEAGNAVFLAGQPVSPNAPKLQDMEVGQRCSWVFNMSRQTTHADVERVA